ncbi:MAG: hypothetical protein WBA44_17525 [Mesorhizobium sp.]
MTQSRYLISQKLSDFQIEQILRRYAEGIAASEAIKADTGNKRRMRAANTVFDIYALVRKRLTEIGYYPDPERYSAYWKSEQDLARSFAFSGAAARIAERVGSLRGATEETLRHHVAEIIFRSEQPEMSADVLFADIKLAIKVTGPLNRPPDNLDLWHERLYLLKLQRHMSWLRRKKSPDIELRRTLMASFEKLIAERTRELRKKTRARGARNLSGKLEN